MSSAIDDRLAKIERVFDAIANSWSSSGTSTTPPALPPVNTQTSFIKKLTAFAQTLDASEQQDLNILLGAAAAAGKQAALDPRNDQQRAASKFLLALDVKLGAGGNVMSGTEITPTVATVGAVTVVTVLASHPGIGCKANRTSE